MLLFLKNFKFFILIKIYKTKKQKTTKGAKALRKFIISKNLKSLIYKRDELVLIEPIIPIHIK